MRWALSSAEFSFSAKDMRGQGRLVEDKTKEHIHTHNQQESQLLDHRGGGGRWQIENFREASKTLPFPASLPYLRPNFHHLVYFLMWGIHLLAQPAVPLSFSLVQLIKGKTVHHLQRHLFCLKEEKKKIIFYASEVKVEGNAGIQQGRIRAPSLATCIHFYLTLPEGAHAAMHVCRLIRFNVQGKTGSWR